MNINESRPDRTIRALLGLALMISAFVWLGLAAGALAGIIAAILGAILLLTALVGFCPAYKVCRISTAPKPGNDAASTPNN